MPARLPGLIGGPIKHQPRQPKAGKWPRCRQLVNIKRLTGRIVRSEYVVPALQIHNGRDSPIGLQHHGFLRLDPVNDTGQAKA